MKPQPSPRSDGPFTDMIPAKSLARAKERQSAHKAEYGVRFKPDWLVSRVMGFANPPR